MSTSANNRTVEKQVDPIIYKFWAWYGGATFFCIIFNYVYGLFSHGVNSVFMDYAYEIPLIFGIIPFTLFCMIDKIEPPCRISYNLYNAGIGTATVGSIYQGILEIYGSTNQLIWVYVIASAALTFCGIVLYIEQLSNSAKRKKRKSLPHN